MLALVMLNILSTVLLTKYYHVQLTAFQLLACIFNASGNQWKSGFSRTWVSLQTTEHSAKDDKGYYQSPLILTELFQHNLINVSYLKACYLYQVMMTLHFLNDVANDAESTQKTINYVIIAGLKSVKQWVN